MNKKLFGIRDCIRRIQTKQERALQMWELIKKHYLTLERGEIINELGVEIILDLLNHLFDNLHDVDAELFDLAEYDKVAE